MPLDASAVAKLLHEFSHRTALRGGNPYRARAYSRAAENLLALTLPLEQIVAEDRLREIPGVGDAIADIIAKLHKTGTHAGLEAMRKDIPAGVLELLSVPGLRPKKVLKLYSELGVASLDGLEQAVRQDRLKNVKGLGAALQSKILQGIDIKRRGEGQRHLHRAAALLEAAEANLRQSHPGLTRITHAGDFRRGCELVSDLSLVAEVPKLDGEKTIRVSEHLTVHLVERSRYGITLLLATGSAQRVDGCAP
jgi:DNA polymerase (family 10)